jgi:hypothetical protein
LKSSDLWRIFFCSESIKLAPILGFLISDMAVFRACVAMAYPERWLDGGMPERGDRVPLREEMVPTDEAGDFIPPTGEAIVNFDMNFNNSKLLFGIDLCNGI